MHQRATHHTACIARLPRRGCGSVTDSAAGRHRERYLNQRTYRADDTLVNHAIPLVINYRF